MTREGTRSVGKSSQAIEPSTLAWLLSAASDTGAIRRRDIQRALDAMIAAHLPVRQAHQQLSRLAADAGFEGADPTAVCFVHREYEQLVELGERSGWCCAAALVDPDGANGAHLGPYLRIAEARVERGEAGGPPQVVSWLTTANAAEDLAEGRTLRVDRQLQRWPFNATGAMDRASGDLPMVLGSLSQLELCFRAEMARTGRALSQTPDDLRDAFRRLLRLAKEVREVSLRMSGLVLAGLARLLLVHARVRGHALPGREGAAPKTVARLMLANAERTLQSSNRATSIDHQGLAGVNVAIVTSNAETVATLDRRDSRRIQRSAVGAVASGG